jgi:UDP-N-acetylmuramate dehydrogenase
MEFSAELSGLIQGEILRDEPLSKHTSFGIGGPADFFIRSKTEADVVAVLELAKAHGIPLMIIGRGTNLLVENGGIRGVVLDLSLACRQLRERPDGLSVGSGVSVMELLDFCARREWGGLEFMAGIPGSVGGAVKVNAGAWDESIGQLVRTIRGYDFSGQAVSLESSQVHFRYRGSNLPADLVITEIELALTHTSQQVIKVRMKEFLRRRSSQPTDQKSAGCVFKNPPGSAAGKLIEKSGCKGLRVGDAEVSSAHANFIVNRGRATAAEVRQLMEQVHARVKEQFGIDLEREILLVGEE